MDYACDYIRASDSDRSHEIRVVNPRFKWIITSSGDPNFLTNIDKLDVFEIEAYPFQTDSIHHPLPVFIDNSINGQNVLSNTLTA